MNDVLTAKAQIAFFVISLIGFIGLLFVIVLGQAKLDEATEKLAYTMLGVFGTIITQQSAYFYARQRPESQEPPNA